MERKILVLLVSKFEERRQQLMEALTEGSAKDFPEYRYMCGTIRGLDAALLEVNDLLRRLKEIENE